MANVHEVLMELNEANNGATCQATFIFKDGNFSTFEVTTNDLHNLLMGFSRRAYFTNGSYRR